MTDPSPRSKCCTTHEAAHVNGGKEFFGYVHRCNEHPRLTRFDKYLRKTRGVESTWRVDGIPVENLAAAAAKLSVPYAPTSEELALLSEVPEEWTRLEGSARFYHLHEVGLMEFKDGNCRLTETGRAALSSFTATDSGAK